MSSSHQLVETSGKNLWSPARCHHWPSPTVQYQPLQSTMENLGWLKKNVVTHNCRLPKKKLAILVGCTGVIYGHIVLPTQTIYVERQIPQNYHSFITPIWVIQWPLFVQDILTRFLVSTLRLAIHTLRCFLDRLKHSPNPKINKKWGALPW